MDAAHFVLIISISITFFRLENTAPSAKDILGTADDKAMRDESKVAPSYSPHQPKKFSFPHRSYGKTKVVQRRFQAEWFDKWTWITYDETKDAVFCIVCQQVSKEKKLSNSKYEPTFVSKGYCNWKEAREAFRSHASTECHKESIERVVTLTETTSDIGESLSSSYANEINQNKNMLLKIFENIRFLARQGLPLGGDGDESNSNFVQLFKLRSADDSSMLEWLQKRTNKYTSKDIQNEILNVLAAEGLEKISNDL